MLSYLYHVHIRRGNWESGPGPSHLQNHKFLAICYLLLTLHLLRIVLSLGCKVFISGSPRMQRYCRLIIKNSVLDSKVCSWDSLIWETVSPRTHKPKIVNELLVIKNPIEINYWTPHNPLPPPAGEKLDPTEKW